MKCNIQMKALIESSRLPFILCPIQISDFFFFFNFYYFYFFSTQRELDQTLTMSRVLSPVEM